MDFLSLQPVSLSEELVKLRREVRAFLASELESGAFRAHSDQWLAGWDPEFSRRLADRGWLGMALPTEFGGSSASPMARFVVVEELLAAGAPVAAHWIADRQSAPTILRFGTQEQKEAFLPRIARGECFFAIGMSEPDTGSDLASVRTRATRTDGGWLLNGSKVWTSGAHHADAMIALVRTEAPSERRHAGLTQVIVELPHPNVAIRPIRLLNGEHHFNEVVFENAFVPDSRVLGEPGAGWMQVTSELAIERSGPERILSTFPLLTAALRWAVDTQTSLDEVQLGRLVARLWALRRLSLAVAGKIDAGDDPAVAAAMVKDLGTRFEGLLIDTVRSLVDIEPDPQSPDELSRMLAEAVLHSPGFTLRGGTNEILRGIVAKSLGGAV
ncbi:acyl-CoA dehydrogenase family protein [Microbacterium trichothecenolyticum]|uniref:Acyl-CoA dehydrogenase n=1 Tax=Microbacterium trichothecenolyticum TaxID=69370 RepID=A0A0M2H714_MICTR|nr:acyl-CoA dehydrogenase family protein [Microbacterium trichothecenolyticum]KJL42314.1 Acyl-CoA dehydrogenase [Microbacterium trichothecenolyticum]